MNKFNYCFILSLIIVLLMLTVTVTYAEEYDWDEINKRFVQYMENGNKENAELLLELLPESPVSYEESLNKPQAINEFFTGKYSDDMLVGAGDVVNINIIFRLRYLTDGAHTSQLNILLGSLITKYPETFLLALEENIYNVNRLDSILCNLGPQFADEFQLQIIELRNRYEALKEVEGVCNVVRELTLTKIQLAICRRERIILEIDINS